MATGSGKTLVASLSYLNALSGDGVRCDGQRLPRGARRREDRTHPPLSRAVGGRVLRYGPEPRRRAYLADITYATGTELAFDHLNDNMAPSPDGVVQRGHNYVLIDEIDSVLIDEARTPLIISGLSDPVPDEHELFADLAEEPITEHHYEVDTKLNVVALLEPGIDHVEAASGSTTSTCP